MFTACTVRCRGSPAIGDPIERTYRRKGISCTLVTGFGELRWLQLADGWQLRVLCRSRHEYGLAPGAGEELFARPFDGSAKLIAST